MCKCILGRNIVVWCWMKAAAECLTINFMAQILARSFFFFFLLLPAHRKKIPKVWVIVTVWRMLVQDLHGLIDAERFSAAAVERSEDVANVTLFWSFCLSWNDQIKSKTLIDYHSEIRSEYFILFYWWIILVCVLRMPLQYLWIICGGSYSAEYKSVSPCHKTTTFKSKVLERKWEKYFWFIVITIKI